MSIKSVRSIYLLLSLMSCLVFSSISLAKKQTISINYQTGNSLRPVVLTGKQILPLQGVSHFNVRVYTHSNGKLKPVPFQIDQRDEKQRYILQNENINEDENTEFVIDENDELVFMPSDISNSTYEYREKDKGLIEVKLNDTTNNIQRWVYIKLDAEPFEAMSDIYYIKYNAESDIIETSSYLLGFNSEKPFILNNFQRKTENLKWSGNLVDTMKVEHTGKFLHFIDFYRNYNDYSSKLSNIKTGPVRLIRRTKNKVSMFLGLKTPEIEMDYIIYKNCFFVDTLIDIPFSIGTFFSDVKTRLSLDWKKQEFTTDMKLYSDSLTTGVVINGKMSEQKKIFSSYKDDSLMINSQLGTIIVTMLIPDELPINYHNFLMDDISHQETPENYPGQWGHFGFMTTEWENVDARPHHMQFQVYMTSAHN